MDWVPPGFAPGFHLTSVAAEVLPKTTDFFSPEHEQTLGWNDPVAGIDRTAAQGRESAASSTESSGTRVRDGECFR